MTVGADTTVRAADAGVSRMLPCHIGGWSDHDPMTAVAVALEERDRLWRGLEYPDAPSRRVDDEPVVSDKSLLHKPAARREMLIPDAFALKAQPIDVERCFASIDEGHRGALFGWSGRVVGLVHAVLS